MAPQDLAAWLRLSLTDAIGNTTARRLLAAFGLPAQIFDQPTAALAQLASPAQIQALSREPPGFAAQLEATQQWLALDNQPPRRVLTLADEDYPQALLNTEDPPLMLYLMGRVELDWQPGIAIVGSRNPTPQGLQNAREFARYFSATGLTVVSGLAMGIDAAAHEGALDGAIAGRLATIAVVGTGLDRVYPKRNLALSHRIAAHGLLVSEYPLGTPPLPPNFPRRNRIISALGEGTVVVEAALQSGSLVTARLAVEQGKDVFAIPGSIHSPLSRGCHALIKQGAKLVETGADVLEELPARGRATNLGRGSLDPDGEPDPATPPETGLLSALGFEPVSLDALVARTGMTASALQAGLLQLELQGQVGRLAGGLFQRIASG